MKRISLVIGLFVASPAFALDECLIGTWHVDTADFAHVLSTQMGGTASYASGGAIMNIGADGAVLITVNSLVLNVQMPDMPTMDVTVDGHSAGSITADDQAWALTGGDYALVGSANVMGQTLSIPFTSATGMFGGGLGEYGCSAGSLSFESTGDTPRMPRHWTR